MRLKKWHESDKFSVEKNDGVVRCEGNLIRGLRQWHRKATPFIEKQLIHGEKDTRTY